VCAACRNFKRRDEIDWEARDIAFKEILGSLPKTDSGYDAVIPSSGGKDSTAQVLKALELGLRPLIVTASTCMLTDVGKRNIENLARFATTIEVTPNRDVRRKLNRLGLELVGDVSHPEHLSIFSTPFRVAVAMNIPVILYGEAPCVEYGGPPGTEQAHTMTRSWISEHAGFLGLRATDFIGTEGITEADMREYMLPADDKMQSVTAYWLGNYYPWSSRDNAKVAVDNGFETRLPYAGNWWDFENLDCALTSIHDFFAWLKYGLARATAQLSVDIRSGFISRAEAMAISRERDGIFPLECMGVSLDAALDHIGMSRQSFMRCCNQHLNTSIFAEKMIEWGQKLTLLETDWEDQQLICQGRSLVA
jgi:N-acetyl sugar amidotransferase